MSYGTKDFPLTLNGSGAYSGTLDAINGIVVAVRVERSAGTPTVTIADSVDTILSAVAVASSTTYHPQAEIQTNVGTATGIYTPYALSGAVTVTITGGTASSTVTLRIKIV